MKAKELIKILENSMKAYGDDIEVNVMITDAGPYHLREYTKPITMAKGISEAALDGIRSSVILVTDAENYSNL